MHKLRLIRIISAILIPALVVAAAGNLAAQTEPSAGDPPPILIPGLGDGAGTPRKPTIAEALGHSADDEESGTVEATAKFTLQGDSRKGELRLTAVITPGWHIYSVTQQKGATKPTRINVADSADFKIVGPFQPDQAPHISSTSRSTVCRSKNTRGLSPGPRRSSWPMGSIQRH
jgi:hypothetical protein